MNIEISYRLGSAYGNSLRHGSTIAISRDVRPSSETLFNAFVEGFLSSGNSIMDIGTAPSPLLYFITKQHGLAGGVMVTASHLASNWNGFKFCDSTGIVISDGTGLERIRSEFEIENRTCNVVQGTIKRYNGSAIEYAEYITSLVHPHSTLSIVFDFGNSVTSVVVPTIMNILGLKFIAINDALDGVAPNRASELTADSLSGLRKAVLETGSSLGIAYDGDGDRVGFVDELGNSYISGNQVIPIFTENLMGKNGKRKIVLDASCSSSVSEFIKSKGGMPVVVRTGHSFCAHEVMKQGALFGGQYSGHYSFPDMGCADDAIFASIKMIEILSKGSKLNELNQFIPKYYASQMVEIPCDDNTKFQIVNEVKKKAKEMDFETDQTDGVKIFSNDKDGWVLIRASNTSPVIRINSDAKSKEFVEHLLSFGVNMVKEVIINH